MATPQPFATPRLRGRTPRAMALVAAAALVAALIGFPLSSTASAAAVEWKNGTQNVTDGFSRKVSSGLGVSSSGGAWTVNTPAAASVDGGRALLNPLVGTGQVNATLGTVSTIDQKLQVTFSLSALPTTSSGYFVYVLTRLQQRGESMGARLKVGPGGVLQLETIQIAAGGAVNTLSQRTTLSAKLAAGQLFTLQVQTVGSSTVQTAARAWAFTGVQPNWQVSSSTSGSTSVAAPGGVRVIAIDNDKITPITAALEAVYGWRMQSSPGQDSGKARPTTATPKPAAPTTAAAASVTLPSASNTGVPAETKLKVVTGKQTITTAGTVIDGWDVHGQILVKAPNVTIKNSIVRGAAFTTSQCLISANTATATNLRVLDSELVPEHPSVYAAAGICGANFTATRLNIHGSVDGVMISRSNATVQDSYIHGEAYYSWDPFHRGASHNDGVQIQGGNNVHIVGNRIEGGNNAAIQVTQDMSAVTNLVIEKNLLDYGTYPVKLSTKKLKSTMSLVRVSNNYFGGHQTKPGYGVLADPGVNLEAMGNVWLANGKAAPAYRGE